MFTNGKLKGNKSSYFSHLYLYLLFKQLVSNIFGSTTLDSKFKYGNSYT